MPQTGGVAARLTMLVTDAQSEKASRPMVCSCEPNDRLSRLVQPEKDQSPDFVTPSPTLKLFRPVQP